jgi:hypothetical protein
MVLDGTADHLTLGLACLQSYVMRPGLTQAGPDRQSYGSQHMIRHLPDTHEKHASGCRPSRQQL